MHVKSPFRRKSTLQRVVDAVSDQLSDAASHVKPDLHAMGGSGKAVKTGLITAGGVVGLTAGSAAISSLRHRTDRERGNS
jgi:formylmethanofuran dehydrogenase subunit C